MKKTESHDQIVLSNFSFNQVSRKFQLLDSSFAKRLVDLKIGSKLLTNSNTYIWSCQPEQFIFFISTLNISPEIIMHTYANMTSYQITKTIFYLWMRKRGKFLKQATPSIYRIYSNQQSYNLNKQITRIKVFQSDTPLEQINWSELKKQCDKFVAVRNRDLVIIDIL